MYYWIYAKLLANYNKKNGDNFENKKITKSFNKSELIFDDLIFYQLFNIHNFYCPYCLAASIFNQRSFVIENDTIV